MSSSRENDFTRVQQLFLKPRATDDFVTHNEYRTNETGNKVVIRSIPYHSSETSNEESVYHEPSILLDWNELTESSNITFEPSSRTTRVIGQFNTNLLSEYDVIFYVQLYDFYGNVLSNWPLGINPNQTSNGLVRNNLSQYLPCWDLSVKLISPSYQECFVLKWLHDNGIVGISFFPKQEGIYSLDVRIRDKSIQGFPKTLNIRRENRYLKFGREGPIIVFGKEGVNDGELSRPWGICLDIYGRVLITDRNNNRIQIFDIDGRFVSKFGSFGTKPGEFNRPTGITVDSSSNIIVADKNNHRIQVFDEDFNFLLEFGGYGTDLGKLKYPWGVAVNSRDQIAVADSQNNRVEIFSSKGVFLLTFHFNSPRGLCFFENGQLLVTYDDNLVAMFCPETFNLIVMYDNNDEEHRTFQRPQGVIIDHEGGIVVCTSGNKSVQGFSYPYSDLSGWFPVEHVKTPKNVSQMGIVASSSNEKAAPDELRLSAIRNCRTPAQSPSDLALGSYGRVYVVDPCRNCVSIYF